MTDYLPGEPLPGIPPAVVDRESGSFTFNSTTLGVDADSGTYADCGGAFVAPLSGRVLFTHAADVDNDGAGFTVQAPVFRTGATVGAGTTVYNADPDDSIYQQNISRIRIGAAGMVTGLTPGDPYNVRLEHRVTSGNGTLLRRTVTVVPVP